MPISEVYMKDCVEGMKEFPDKFFDLAIVDPPYDMLRMGAQTGGEGGKLKFRNYKMSKIVRWDNKPCGDYFEELFRVSKKQIIWGGNYFDLPATREIICWDKCQPFNNFSAWEMGWTSFNGVAKIFKYDNRTGDKIHPTQKPVALYRWCLEKYAKPGWKILDTHMGSQSSRIASWQMGFDYWGFEIDQEYFEAGCARFKELSKQLNLYATGSITAHTHTPKTKQQLLFETGNE